MSQARPGSFPQNFPFELREDGQQTGHGATPEFTSRTCNAIVQPRRAAYSRIARFCIASVC
jgi:hypothetical protein